MLVRNGVDVILRDPQDRKDLHTFMAVYGEMMLTVAMNYNSAPNVLEMTSDEIEYFYNGIRRTLRESTKPNA